MSNFCGLIIVVSCLFANVPTWMFWLAIIASVFAVLEHLSIKIFVENEEKKNVFKVW